MPFPLLRTALGALVPLGAYLLFRRKPLVLNCSSEFHASYHGGKRDPARCNLIVLHSTEGSVAHWKAGGNAGRQPSAKGVAQYFAAPGAGGSTQYVVDDTSCYQCLPDDVVPNAAGNADANLRGLHVELCGYAIDPVTLKAGWTRAEWLAHDDTLRRAAAIAMGWGYDYQIRMRFLDAAALHRGERDGVTSHWEITKGLNGGTGHVDPGVNFPWDVFARYAGFTG